MTVGTFDGIHLGHQYIIQELVRRSQEKKDRSVLVTFHPHPQSIIRQKNDSMQLLTPLDEKLTILENFNLDVVLIIPFTKKMLDMEPETFIHDVLVQHVGVYEFIIGYNHAFGRERRGDVELINALGKRYHFSVDVVNPVQVEGDIISSTKIRQMLSEGAVSKVNRYLGRNYRLEGVVKKGNNRGQKFGFPTANIDVIGEQKVIPKNGVYAVLVTIEGDQYLGMTNIGYRPTVDGKHLEIEVHVHNFSGNLYHKHIQIEFIQRIRDEKQFESVDALVLQIERDRVSSIEMLSDDLRRQK
ncbi:bifunctional riboflavin kinase/FAD synthetase [bacterium]|nr:bifunctional riboflavin kinase/FAD synthetase [bacterium]